MTTSSPGHTVSDPDSSHRITIDGVPGVPALPILAPANRVVGTLANRIGAHDDGSSVVNSRSGRRKRPQFDSQQLAAVQVVSIDLQRAIFSFQNPALATSGTMGGLLEPLCIHHLPLQNSLVAENAGQPRKEGNTKERAQDEVRELTGLPTQRDRADSEEAQKVSFHVVGQLQGWGR